MSDLLPSLATERLILRPFRPSDAPDIERLAGAREVADTTLNIPHPYPEGSAAGWIANHPAMWAEGAGLTLAITLRENTDAIIGAISLAIKREHLRAELGYWVAADRWGRGYATEASRAMLEFGFSQLALHRIHAAHFTRNPASGRVMQKLGMQHEGVIRDAFLRWGRFEDVALYGILANEWTASSQ